MLAVVRGIRLNDWNTNPIFRLRICDSAASSSVRTSIPSMKNWPLDGMSRQPRMFIIVDFPDPEAPMIATKSPRSTVIDTPRSAVTSTSPI